MDKFQGIFDQGFSGILDDTSTRKTMPDYLEKLAEEEKDFKAEKIEAPVIPFDKDSGLSRANDLTSDGSRESHDNRFTIEKQQREANTNKIKALDNIFETQSIDGKDFDSIHASLLKKYPNELVNKFLESKIKLELNKYAYLGFENLEEKKATLIEQAKVEYRIKRSTVHDILDKFSKLEFVSNNVVKQYKDMLGSKRPLFIVAKFLFSLDSIKDSYYNEKEARVAFKRDVDEKFLSLREINANLKKNAEVERQNVFLQMLNEFKQGINSKLSRSQIDHKLAKIYGLDKLQSFHSKFKDEINKFERFSNRQNFATDFASAVQQGVEISPKSKPVSINAKEMLNHAFNLMTQGNDLNVVTSSLKRQFGLEATNQFLSEYDYKLNKHHGQLGYLFLDSNIYSTCDEMSDAYSKLQHVGSQLIYSLRANSKCSGCSLHKEGRCEKVGLLVSNNPVVRSSRAARRVFSKASFLPKEYVDSFIAQIKNEEGNSELVSKFTLGIQAALDSEKKNIGKQASKDRTETTQSQESFVGPDDNFDVEIFSLKNTSSIIDEVLGFLDKKAFNIKIDDWDVKVESRISKGADPTQIEIVTLKRNNDKIILQEFQGIVSIDWRAPKAKGQKIPDHITVSKFAGADNTKDLDKLLETVGAPSWTKIMDEYNKE